MYKQNVVITGCDVVGKQVIGLNELSECMKGKPFIEHSRESIRSLANQIFPPNYCRRMDDFTVLGLLAAHRAVNNAKLEFAAETDPNRGSIFSTEWGPIGSTFDFLQNIMTNGTKNASPFKFPYTVTNAMCGVIARTYKCGGVSSMLVGCCPIHYAYHLIQNRQADCIIVGAVDDYCSMLEQVNECDNSIFSGAACIIMESEEYALERNADIICEVMGAESYHLTSNKSEDISVGIHTCDQSVLAQSSKQLSAKDYVISNGNLFADVDNTSCQNKVELMSNITFMGTSSVMNSCAAICKMKEHDAATMYLLHSLFAKCELNSLLLRKY